jgi:ribosomal protein L11 methyltransferase
VTKTGAAGRLRLCVEVPARLADAVGEALIAAGCPGVEQRHGAGRRRWLLAWPDGAAAARRLGRRARDAARRLGATARVRVEAEPGDAHAWLARLRPVRLTPSLVWAPAGSVARGARTLRFEPAAAFGDGTHATTRLAARAVQRWCGAVPRARVLDVGSGNGVLALVAAASGARRVLGIEVDPTAVRAARRNAALNRSHARFTRRPLSRAGRRWDIVVANLLERDQRGLLHALAGAAEGARVLLLTGLLAEQVPPLLAEYAALGYRRIGAARSGEWRLVALRR